jgi:hypothetical protein
LTHAEDLADLVHQLVDEVRTVAPVTRYRTARRGAGRTETAIDLTRHHTRSPGLLHQLHAIQAAAAAVPVKTYRWQKDDGDQCKELCAHGRWIHVRTEQRPIAGVVTAGAAVPGGSPGWDQDGALNPLRSLGFESRTPATSATELLSDITAGAGRLRADLRAAAGKTRGARRATSAMLRELVGLALDVDDATADAAVHSVRGWVSAARVLLGYDAPIVALRDMYCSECRGELYVRADASTAVWCAGRPALTVHGPALLLEDWPVRYPAYDGCGTTYPQGSWIRLLEQAG